MRWVIGATAFLVLQAMFALMSLVPSPDVMWGVQRWAFA